MAAPLIIKGGFKMSVTRFAKSGIRSRSLGLIDASGNLTEVVDGSAVVKNVTIQSNCITSIDDDVIWASMIASGNGYGKGYPKTTNTTDDLVPAVSGDHDLLLIVKVTEAFAGSGTDGQPEFKIGEGISGVDDKYFEESDFADLPVDSMLVKKAVLDNEKTLRVTGATHTGGTGAIHVMAFVVAQPT